MDITWYGLSCFRIREGGVTVVCDPYDKSVSSAAPKLRADIITISHMRPGHSAVDRVAGDAKVLSGPGEYEVKNVFVSALATYHRKHKDKPLERNIAYFLEFGDLTVGHLGDIGEVPHQSEIEALNVGEVDILLVPVGGGDTLDPVGLGAKFVVEGHRLQPLGPFGHPGLGHPQVVLPEEPRVGQPRGEDLLVALQDRGAIIGGLDIGDGDEAFDPSGPGKNF